MHEEVCTLPELSDNMTMLIAITLVGGFVTVMVYIAAKQIGGPLHRLAKAIEDRNRAESQKGRPETGAKSPSAQTEIAGNTLWDADNFPLEYRLSGRPEIAEQYVGPTQSYDSGVHTASFPVEDPVPVGRAQDLPFDVTDPHAIFDYMMQRINGNNTNPETQQWPWDIHSSYANTQGAKWSNYDVERKHIQEVTGVSLPENMHRLWRELHKSEVWSTYGPEEGSVHYSAQYPPPPAHS